MCTLSLPAFSAAAAVLVDGVVVDGEDFFGVDVLLSSVVGAREATMGSVFAKALAAETTEPSTLPAPRTLS